MIKAYIGNLLNYSYLPLLYPNLGFQSKKSLPIIKNAFKFFKDPVIELVENVSDADIIVLPHDYSLIMDNKNYLSRYIHLSEKYNKKIIIFSHSDYDEIINIPNSIVFRTSQYRYKKRSNEIIMPPYVEDLSIYKSIINRNKNKIPVIGFCGLATYKNTQEQFTVYLKNFKLEIMKILTLNKNLILHKRGVYFRKKIIEKLEKTSLIKTNFIIRKTYSGHISTAELPIDQLRSEYIENFVNSDLALIVKGNGNFSLRFYEALSLGRVPLFIDTDCMLPLEEIINYNKFVFSFNIANIKNIDKLVAESFEKINNEQFIKMQNLGRLVFEKYLRIDSFFKFIFLDNNDILNSKIKNNN